MNYKEWLRTLSNRDLHYLIDRQEKIMQQIPKGCCIERRTKKKYYNKMIRFITKSLKQ